MAALLASIPQIAANFQWKDALDITIVACLIYGFLLLLQRTHSRFIINGISILLVIYLIARYLSLYLTSTLFQAFFTFFVVIIVVIFQRELRNFFEWIYVWSKFSSKTIITSDTATDQIIQAVDELSQKKIGALMVLPHKLAVDNLIQGGITLNGRFSIPLILSIFDPSSPGHDGAIIVEGDRIKKFGVHLPLADRFDGYQDFGTRHRAALGLAERSDALIIVVSEEKGTVSVAYKGKLRILHRSDELKEVIRELLQNIYGSSMPSTLRWHTFITHHLREKFLAIIFTLLFWYVFVIQLGTGIISRDFKVPIEFRFLPDEYNISQLSTDSATISLSGSNQDFSLLDVDKLKIIINLPKPVEGYQRIKIDKSIISHPGALSVNKFFPAFIDFKITQKTPNNTQ